MRKRTNAGWQWPRSTLSVVLCAAAAGTLACSWWLATVPPGLTINDACQPEGVRASAVAWLDPATYWRSQLLAARRERNEVEEAIAREPQRAAEAALAMAGANRMLAEMKATNAALEELIYQKHPELRPSPAAERASELREMADAIEQQAAMERCQSA